MSDAMLGGIVPWFGSKRTLAPRIVAELGPHSCYWELFAGSMAVLLAKPPCRAEWVNDFHGDLVNLARCLSSAALGMDLHRRLRRVLSSEDEFRRALDVILSGDAPGRSAANPDLWAAPCVDRAVAYFIVSWQGMNGFGGTSKPPRAFARRFTSTGGDPARRWATAVGSIPAWRRRLGRASVLRSDGIELARRIEDRAGTVIYADPPYVEKGAKYLHDFDDRHHAELAAALCRFRETRVVVSYYTHPDLAALYPGWRVEDVAITKGIANAERLGRTGAVKAPEVLICNFPAHPAAKEAS